MSKYFRTPQAMGERPFRCPICNKIVAIFLTGSSYEICMRCNRCKSTIIVACNEEIPAVVRDLRKLQIKEQQYSASKKYPIDEDYDDQVMEAAG